MATPPLTHPTRGRLRASLRVIGYLIAANIVLTTAGLSLARAQAEGAAKQAGLGLLKQLGPVVLGSPQTVTLNGQRMFLGSRVTPLDVHEVLARFERHCREDAPSLAEELNSVPEPPNVNLPEALNHPERWLMSRAEAGEGDVGQLACLAGKSGGGMRRFLVRLQQFAVSGDLSSLGDMRYVVARRDTKARTTHVLTMWTEGVFNVRAMFPRNQDVPGGDSENAPRPPKAMRILAAHLGELPYAIRVYSSQASRAEVLDSYQREMTARGFSAPLLPAKTDAPNLNPYARSFAKQSGSIIVVATDGPDAKTVVSLLEMGSLGFVHGYESEAK